MNGETGCKRELQIFDAGNGKGYNGHIDNGEGYRNIMNYIRLTAFLLIVAGAFTLFATTYGIFTKDMKLGLDLKGGIEILYEASPVDQTQTVTKDSLKRTATSLMNRINATVGQASEPEITLEGKDRIRVKLAVKDGDQQRVRELLKKPAALTFRSGEGFKKIELYGYDFKENAAKKFYNEAGILEGITVEVKDAAKLAEVSRRLQGQQLAIFLDEQELTAPVVQSVITNGSAQITGGYTEESAKELADVINLGALPLNLTEKYSQTVGASLGQAALEKTVFAGVVASIAILLFMVLFYRLPGAVASITIIAYIWLLLLIFYWMDATLTLPGIAAFILGIGMAVDANIITFERIRDEMRNGKSVMAAHKAGSSNSLRTILDANITTIIAGLVLYFMGFGAVQSFAIILIMSILVSMLTNVLFSRFLLNLLLRTNLFKKPGYYGVKESEINAL